MSGLPRQPPPASSEDTLEEVPDEDDAPTLPDSPRSLPPPPPSLEGPATERPPALVQEAEAQGAPAWSLDRATLAPDTIPQSMSVRPSTPPR